MSESNGSPYGAAMSVSVCRRHAEALAVVCLCECVTMRVGSDPGSGRTQLLCRLPGRVAAFKSNLVLCCKTCLDFLSVSILKCVNSKV